MNSMPDLDNDRLELLREALPYIRRFKGKTFVVKLGGRLAGHEEALLSLAEEIALLDQVGFRLLLVHGGGEQVNELAARLGIEQKIVHGRRVTDSATLELAKMVFSGKVRTDILSVLRRLGVHTVGLSGLDGGTIRARKRAIQKLKDKETGKDVWVDFGHVGDIVQVDDRLLSLLLENGYVPVISSLGADDEGNVYNINADTVASEIAGHLRAEKLIFLSDVDGILRRRDDPSSRISHLTLEEAELLLSDDSIDAGMIPKVAAIVALLKRGVRSAHVVSGLRRNALLQEVFTAQGAGTMISA